MSESRKARCLTANELNSSISSKKSKKRKKQKPCLANPLVVPHDSNPKSFSVEVRKLLQDVLPKREKLPHVPYDEIKNIPVAKRRRFRNQFRKTKSQPTVDQSVLKYFLFGANRVTRHLEKETLAAVILNSEHGKIFFMVKHIQTICETKRIACINCDNLNEITSNFLQLKQCLAIGIREPSDTGDNNGTLMTLIKWIRQNSNIKPKNVSSSVSSAPVIVPVPTPAHVPTLPQQTEQKLTSLTLIEPNVKLLKRSQSKRAFEIPETNVAKKPESRQTLPLEPQPTPSTSTASERLAPQTSEPEKTQPKFQLPFQLFNHKLQTSKIASNLSALFKPIKMKFVPDKTADSPSRKKRKKK